MGWAGKLSVVLLGLAAFGFGVWPVGLVCFGYFLLSFRSRRRPSPSAGELHTDSNRFPLRVLLATVLFVLAIMAFASGGTYSPVVMTTLAILTLAYPWLPVGSLTDRVLPVEGSILVRKRFLPLRWHALAEVKPGSEDLPRAMSSFSGGLLVSEVGGSSAYVVFSVFALTRRSAERSIVSMMRDAARTLSPRGAYLLPVDSQHLPGFLSQKLMCRKGVESTGRNFDELVADVLVLESRSGFVGAMAAYASSEAQRENAALPSAGRTLSQTPNLWELLESVGKRHPWAGPDSYTGLLNSLQATRGEPMAERIAQLAGSGANVLVKGLGGEELELSRPQFRAIAEIYH